MGRVAGDDPGYTFALCRVEYVEDTSPAAILRGEDRKRVLTPTSDAIVLPSASTIIGEVLAKPPSAMAWWGYRVGLDAVSALINTSLDADRRTLIADQLTAEILEMAIKQAGGATPNTSLEKAGGRGNDAHEILECLAAGDYELATAMANNEVDTDDGRGVLGWWDNVIQPYIDSGEIVEVLSEVRVWSLEDQYAGTFDLALHWVRIDDEGEPIADLGWEVLDLKTHKPASGFTKDGKGPAYISDVVQIRAYRKAFEEMGKGPTFGQRVVIARDKAYRGVRWLEDAREVDYDLFRHLRAAYDHRLGFER